MLGGGAFVLLWLPGGLLAKLLGLLGLIPENASAIDNVVYGLLMLGAMAAIVALYVLQKRRYGWTGSIASLIAFVGLASAVVGLVIGYGATGPAGDPVLALEGLLFGGGLLASTVGIIALGILTIALRRVPWWCGVALIVGSPLFVLLGLPLLSEVGGVALVPVGLGWVLVGYAILRAAGRQTERPPRAQ